MKPDRPSDWNLQGRRGEFCAGLQVLIDLSSTPLPPTPSNKKKLRAAQTLLAQLLRQLLHFARVSCKGIVVASPLLVSMRVAR